MEEGQKGGRSNNHQKKRRIVSNNANKKGENVSETTARGE